MQEMKWQMVDETRTNCGVFVQRECWYFCNISKLEIKTLMFFAFVFQIYDFMLIYRSDLSTWRLFQKY